MTCWRRCLLNLEHWRIEANGLASPLVMELSETELRMLEKLRRRQQLLRRYRVPLLILHGLITLSWFVLLIIVVQMKMDVTGKLIVVSYVLPPIFIFMGISSFWFGYMIRNWRGEPNTTLLLKIVDELRKPAE